MSEDLKVGKIEFAPLKEGTQRVLRTSDITFGVAFNQAVAAIREMQVAIDELQRAVVHLTELLQKEEQ